MSKGSKTRWEVRLEQEVVDGIRDIRDEHGENAYDEALDDLLALEEDPIPPDAEELQIAADLAAIETAPGEPVISGEE